MAVYLTTVDNPFNPETQFREWYSYDIAHGYDCSGRLARETATSYALSPGLNREEIERAIDEIVSLNENGLYRKFVTNSDEETENAA